MVELLHSKVYWPSMFTDTDHWLSQCERCHIAKGDYTEPKTQQGSLIAHQPLELLCIDFTKADVARGGKENILVLTDAFSKFSQAFVTSSQKSLVLPNYWLRNGLAFSVFQPGSIVIRDGLSIMRLFLTFVRCMEFISQPLLRIILMAMHYVNGSIILYLAL